MGCDRYIPNSTFQILKTVNPYEGIPENFIVNIIAFTILIGVFLFLRRKAWNYGDLSWLHKPLDIMEAAPLKSWTYNSIDDVDTNAERVSISEKSESGIINFIWNILPQFIKMSDKALAKHRGTDAVIYCRFQRGLMLVAAVMMVLCLTVILPVNLNGGLLSNDSSSFSTLTIANIKKESNVLAVHLCISVILMLFSFFISHRFLNYIDIEVKEKPTFTLMITDVPAEHCEKTLLEQHFQEAYPSVNVLKIEQAFEIGQLFSLYTKKFIAEDSLIFCYEHLEDKNEHIMVSMNRFICPRCQCFLKKSQTIDGIEFYSQEVKQWSELYLKEKEIAINTRKLPIFFVSFQTLQEALKIRREYIYQNYCCLKQVAKSQSSLSTILKPQKWKVQFAAMPKDILWENLHKKGWKLWVPIILANIFIGFVVIMLSTPAMVFSVLATYNITNTVKSINVYFSQVLPSISMALVASLIPILICWSNDLSSHWTKTKLNISIMNRIFIVLLMTILILPSLGLNSVYTLTKILFNKSVSFDVNLECIFMPDGGALFCNYLITATFIGLGVAILRLGELFLYAIRICFTRSRAENNAIAKSFLWEFSFGINYAWTLALFCIMTAYSVIVPLITPFGLAYLISKYFLDRYNMIYVYSYTFIDNEVHANAAMLMQVCLIFTQCTVTVYVYFRRNNADALVICCFIAISFGFALMLGRIFQRKILDLAWIKYHDKSILTDLTRIFRSPRYNLETNDVAESFVFLPEQVKKPDNKIFLDKMRTISISNNVSESSMSNVPITDVNLVNIS